MKLKIVLVAIVCISYVQLFSQEPCKVLKSEISEKYEGKCKKGLANGKGLATGKDKYEGDFKNGLPHGNGKYTWSSGEVYDGKWKEGKRNGEGKYFYKKNGIDSIKIGIWKDDIFLKKIVPAPYRIIRSSSVSRFSVQKSKEGNKVLFSFMQNGANDSNVSNLLFTTNCGTTYNLGLKQGFDNVVFPFTCKVSYKTMNSLKTIIIDVYFEIEIREPGYWEIFLSTN